MDDVVKTLQSVIEKELTSKELVDLDPEIYITVSSRIKEIFEIYKEKVSEIGEDLIKREIELLSFLVRELFIIRMTKFFFNSLEGKNNTKLTLQERFITSPILDSMRRLQKLNEAIQYGFSFYLENLPQTRKYILVKFLDSLDKFVGSDLENYGPFEKGDIALLPIDNAKILIDKNIAEDVGVV